MKLLIDAGNSRLKWAWWDGVVLDGVSAAPNAGMDFSALWKNGQKADSVWIASVASVAANAALAAALRDRFGVEPVFAATR
ncbi:MAG TPA: type III pantothenate kinase, partial [Rudaea sp.]|nr:type III pantothenate kinase [Rudaea sp.]